MNHDLLSTTKGTAATPGGSPRASRLIAAVISILVLAAMSAGSAFANAPNPSSIKVESVVAHGSSTTVTVSGTWTWNVPNGAQKDCNDSRIGVGYAVSWGDNNANPLRKQGNEPTIYVGTPTDNWVHSVTQGTIKVAGPFKSGGGLVEESMLGETPEAMLYGYGSQGISTGAVSAVPTNEDAAHWYSNCGPTAQSEVNGQKVGNSNPANPEQGYPNGTWGPISHTYTTPGEYKICPVLYDPHGHQVGQAAQNAKEITAGGSSYNNDNSLESNGNASECTIAVTIPTPKPAFTIEKLQSFSAAGGFTKSELTGALGQTVHYGILVHNTGNVKLTFAPLTDAKCEGISPSGATELASGGEETFTCAHVLSSTGRYTNVASIHTSEDLSHESNEVVVGVPSQGFTIAKQQKLAGAGSYTTEKLTAKLGETVDYLITVTNTGEAPETFGPLLDPNCTNIHGGPTGALAHGESASWTCEHTLTANGDYQNAAIATGNREPKESNKVIVEVPAEGFTIKKEQKLAGKGEYTTAKLTAQVGETVDYLITVENTGEAPQTFAPLSDANCTNIQGGPTGALKHGEKASWTCEHTLTAMGMWENVATAEGNKEPKKSNPVTVEAAAILVKPECRISESVLTLHGAGGSKRKAFNVQMPSLGIAQITFYLDGKKLTTLTAAQAKNGQFTIKINPRKLSYGAHKVSITTVMTDSACPNLAREAVFVHPRQAKIKPKFTG